MIIVAWKRYKNFCTLRIKILKMEKIKMASLLSPPPSRPVTPHEICGGLVECKFDTLLIETFTSPFESNQPSMPSVCFPISQFERLFIPHSTFELSETFVKIHKQNETLGQTLKEEFLIALKIDCVILESVKSFPNAVVTSSDSIYFVSRDEKKVCINVLVDLEACVNFLVNISVDETITNVCGLVTTGDDWILYEKNEKCAVSDVYTYKNVEVLLASLNSFFLARL